MMQSFVKAMLRAQSLYRQIIQRKMKEHNIDISFEMLHIMKNLRYTDKINQQELANLTDKDKSSLSYLIKNMEKRGFIFRIESKEDKRSKLVLLTEEGKRIHDEIVIIVNDVYEKLEKESNREHMQICIKYMNEFNKIANVN